MSPGADPLMSIGEFARRSRLSMKALRLYDRLGVLKPAEIEVRTGYRRYRESQLDAARLIVMLRRLDMPLNDVSEVVGAATGAERSRLVGSYWSQVESRVAFQRELARHLQTKLSGQGNRLDGFVVREREVPEVWVLCEQRHIVVDELVDWITAVSSRLRKAVADHAGTVGNDYVIYHGEVNEDSDGPVEFCLPIDPVAATTGKAVPADCVLRRERAHRAAYVRLRKAQVQYPQILSAYDAVDQWIVEHDRICTGSPREIYVADYTTAAPDHEVCDVAFPIE